MCILWTVIGSRLIRVRVGQGLANTYRKQSHRRKSITIQSSLAYPEAHRTCARQPLGKTLESHVKFVDGYLMEFSAIKISNGIVIVKGWISLLLSLPHLNNYRKH